MSSYQSWNHRPDVLRTGTPVIITLHGVGSNYHDLPGIIEPVQDQSVQFHIQGDLNYGSGFAYYMPDFSKPVAADQIMNTAVRLQEEIQSLIQTNGLNDHPIYLLGFSQGAIMSQMLLANYPEYYTGGVILNARLPRLLQPKPNALHLFIAQGINDPIFPKPAGEEIADAFRSAGSTVSYHEYPVAHGIEQQGLTDITDWLQSKIESTKIKQRPTAR